MVKIEKGWGWKGGITFKVAEILENDALVVEVNEVKGARLIIHCKLCLDVGDC